MTPFLRLVVAVLIAAGALDSYAVELPVKVNVVTTNSQLEERIRSLIGRELRAVGATVTRADVKGRWWGIDVVIVPLKQDEELQGPWAIAYSFSISLDRLVEVLQRGRECASNDDRNTVDVLSREPLSGALRTGIVLSADLRQAAEDIVAKLDQQHLELLRQRPPK